MIDIDIFNFYLIYTYFSAACICLGSPPHNSWVARNASSFLPLQNFFCLNFNRKISIFGNKIPYPKKGLIFFMELLNQNQIAKRLGLTKGRISQLVSEGRLNSAKVVDPTTERVLYNFTQVERTLAKENSTIKLQTEEGMDGELGQLDSDNESISLDQARAKKMHYESKLAELQYKKEIGELVDAEKVRKIAYEIALWVRDSFMLLPQKISPILSSKRNPDDIEKILDTEFEYILMNLANKDPLKHILKEDEGEED